jgi:hypothetical protein
MKGHNPHVAWRLDITAVARVALAMGALGCVGQVGNAGPSGGGSGGNTPAGAAGITGSAGSGTGNGSGSAGSTAGGGGSGQPTPLTLDSGRTTIRRLNRTEFSLTVQDLLGTSTSFNDKLPEDATSEGFDTIGQYLTFSPLHAESMEAAATSLIDELFALPSTDARRTKVLPCTLRSGSEATCARQVLTTFTRRAYRRPATTAEIDGLMALIDKVRMGGTYEEGLKAALIAVILSPHFLYKEETSVGLGTATQAKPLNSFELATRLSYFLWSTMPDDALSASADAGKLATDMSELSTQIERMLSHSKAAALTTNFATQWLTVYRLDTVAPDTDVYPSYDDALRVAAQKETTTFFSHLISDNLPLATLVNADFTYANARLGKHYGLSVTGDALVRVSLTGTPRAGLLTQTSFLMGNAHPHRSSPVKRGDWILERFLCAATPPPPPNVVIPDLPPANAGISGRKFLEDHRKNPACAPCHNTIDPIGLGVENFDAIGAYRTTDSGVAVDASGTYLGTTPFNGAIELAQLIAQDARFPMCVTKHLLTYSVGRPFSSGAALTYAKALAEHAVVGQQATWRQWIAMIAASEALRTNWPEPQ